MVKLVVLKLGDGTFEQGFPVTLQIGEETARPSTEVAGSLPAVPEIAQYFQQWQQVYRQLGMRSRLSAQETQVTNISIVQDCNLAAHVLHDSLNRWLNSESFRIIREKLLERLSPWDEIRVLLQTKDLQLQRLPWHLWDFFERYPKAEVALSAPAYERAGQATPPRERVRILAILGNSSGIDIQADRALLEQLSGAEVSFVAQPQRRELADYFWRQSWDILFFAGHSSTEANSETGWIEISPTERISIAQLKYALKKGVERGLKLAIFNSCDGLGLAQNLADLRIPQIIVMRDPVPDEIAQEFLKNFLEAFSQGESFYLAVREARERLEGLEDQFPCATWLPVIFQNPAEVPPTWQDLCSGSPLSPAASQVKVAEQTLPPRRLTVIPPPPPPTQRLVELTTATPAPPARSPELYNHPSDHAIDQAFLDYCRQELAREIGPIASLLITNLLATQSQFSAQQLIDALASNIPDLHQAETFRQRLDNVLNSSAQRKPPELASASQMATYRIGEATTGESIKSTPRSPSKELPGTLTPGVLEQCQQELAQCIGPIASIVFKTALKQHPQATLQQLVETLAASIPNTQQAEQFKRNLLP